MMRLYHHTTQTAATQILADGFRDSRGDSFFVPCVWLSDSPDACNRAMRGRSEGVMLMIDVSEDVAQRFLVADFPGRWREFCIPADVVNRLPVARATSVR